MKFFKPFELPTEPSFPELCIDIRDYGVKEGGEQKATEAIRNAIDDCSKRGGGRVVIPEGKWLTGAIHLKSNVNLHIEKGASVMFSTDFEDYLPVVYGVLAGIRCYSPSHFIYAHKCENIAITGEGTFDGNGEFWYPMKDHQPGMEHLATAPKRGIGVENRVYDKIEYGVRPRMLQFIDCKNILLDGPTFINSPSWTIHLVYSRNIIVRNLSIKNPLDAANTDGINFESCKRGLMEHCYVTGGDDLVCLKAGRDEDAWEVGIPCEDIEIRHCWTDVSKSGITLGSEMSAGIRNAYIHDCSLGKANVCINIKTMKGRRGCIENIDYENLSIDTGCADAVCITMKYAGEPLDDQSKPLENMPVIRNLSIENFRCNNATKGIFVNGIEEYEIENIYFKDISIRANNPLDIGGVKNICFENMNLQRGEAQQRMAYAKYRGRNITGLGPVNL